MRETGFIEQNKEKWEEFEQVLKEKNRDPDALSDLFIQITDDLSYSRTFYPNRSVRVYLNHLAQLIFSNIYKRKKGKRGAFANFWMDELPQIMSLVRVEMRISYFIFLGSFVIGMLSSAFDPEFPALVLGEDYITMTERNIDAGDPMRVYKETREINMFLGITRNNIQVAFYAFCLGALFSIGTVYILMFNGIMLGAFQYFFIERGLFWESFHTVWLHGTLEISAIIIAGGAGITMGKGLIFPGTYTRLQSFQVSALRGLKIMLGLVPIFIMAGFIEGYLTRHTEAPYWIRQFIISGSLLFILGYFMVLPMIKRFKGFKKPLVEKRFPPSRDYPIDFNSIRTNGETFSDLFVFFRKHFGKIFRLTLPVAIIYAVVYFLYLLEGMTYFRTPEGSFEQIIEVFFEYFGEFKVFFDHVNNEALMGLNAGLIYLVSFLSFYLLAREAQGESIKSIKARDLFNHLKEKGFYHLIVVIAISLYLALPGAGWGYLGLLLLPFLLLYTAVIHFEKTNPFTALARTFKLIGGNFIKWWGMFMILGLVSLLFLSILGSPIQMIFFRAIKSFVLLDDESITQVYQMFYAFSAMAGFGLLLSMMCIGMGLFFFSQRELTEASHLKERVEQLGKKKTVYGIRQVE